MVLLGFVLAGASWSSAEERFRWRGDVDGTDEILIRGREVTINHLDAQPLRNQQFRFSAALPSRAVHVTLEVVRGRGEVRLMEQPSARNDFTAVVRIEDERGGDSRYEFELVWDEDEDEDSWKRDRVDGLFHWEGRVDKGVDVTIRGDLHTLSDMGGQGTRERVARFESALPRESVEIYVEKLEGRGDVDLLQAPSSANDYTAIVRIEDDKGGADDYEFELRWRR